MNDGINREKPDYSHYAQSAQKLKKIQQFYSCSFFIHLAIFGIVLAVFLGVFVNAMLSIREVLMLLGYIALTIVDTYVRNKKIYVVEIAVSLLLLIIPLTIYYVIAIYVETEHDKLKQLEGYPYFNERFSEANSRKGYIPDFGYKPESVENKEMVEVSYNVVQEGILEDMYTAPEKNNSKTDISEEFVDMPTISDI